MVVFDGLERLNEAGIKGCVVTIGNFDGVHLGHRALINKLKERAKQLSLPSVVITFDPHPLKVLKGKCPPVITPIKQKIDLLEEVGIDIIICLKFDKDIAGLSAVDFIKTYLIEPIDMKEIIIGYDYRFGKNREGDFELLKKMGIDFGFKVWRVDPVFFQGKVISSTRIRNLVQQGLVWETKDLLGRFYQVFGHVVKGHRRGGEVLGIPTANLNLIDELVPKTGVYAVFGEVNGIKYPGVANVGYNPTFGNHVLSVEVHLFNFNKNIYGVPFRVYFIKRIRSEKKFPGVMELKAQILNDIETARLILKDVEI